MASTPAISAEKNVTSRWLGMETVNNVPHAYFYSNTNYLWHTQVQDTH